MLNLPPMAKSCENGRQLVETWPSQTLRSWLVTESGSKFVTDYSFEERRGESLS